MSNVDRRMSRSRSRHKLRNAPVTSFVKLSRRSNQNGAWKSDDTAEKQRRRFKWPEAKPSAKRFFRQQSRRRRVKLIRFKSTKSHKPWTTGRRLNAFTFKKLPSETKIFMSCGANSSASHYRRPNKNKMAAVNPGHVTSWLGRAGPVPASTQRLLSGGQTTLTHAPATAARVLLSAALALGAGMLGLTSDQPALSTPSNRLSSL